MMLDGGRRMLESEARRATNVNVTLRRFWDYFKQYRLAVFLVIVLTIGSVGAIVAAPQIIGQAVDCYLFPNPDACYAAGDVDITTLSTEARIAGIGPLALTLVVLYLGSVVMRGASFFTMRWTGQNVLRQLRQDLFRHIHRLTLSYYSENEAGDVMSRVTNDTDTLNQAFSFALLNVINGVLTVVLVIIAMLTTNLPYALLSLSILPLMIWATRYFSRQARRAFRETRKRMGSVNADLQESIAGAREVQAFNREEQSIAQFREVNEANRQANVRAAAFTSALGPVLEALGFVSLAIVVLVGGLSALRNEALFGTEVISLGVIFAFVQYVQNFNRPIQQIAILWTNVQSAIAGGERIFNLLDVQPDIQDAPNAQPMPPIVGHVRFEGVKTQYKPGELVLKGIDFEAQPGETVAIVGPTGAGKTTIVNLIPRFYEAFEGRVSIDGHDLRSVTRESLRAQIGIVLQDSFLFSTTVMDNIRYGRRDASDEEVIAAAKLVQAHDFIQRLPEGYHTVLGERGGGLSQGQRQLLSIARAALLDPRVLILDEATSSVDTRTERLIQAALDTLLAGRTSFVIAHRLSTIRNADQVLMLVDGQIVERGTHDDLLAQRGAYYDLYMSQFSTVEAESAAD